MIDSESDVKKYRFKAKGARDKFFFSYCTCNPSALQQFFLRGGADKSLVRPGRKQATATKFGIYSTYPPRSSIHFLVRCSNFCKPLKKNSEGCPSNQGFVAAMTSMSDEKWQTFICFFQSREQAVV
jgi:hypothetical protein